MNCELCGCKSLHPYDPKHDTYRCENCEAIIKFTIGYIDENVVGQVAVVLSRGRYDMEASLR
jgi:hypothetical protein